LINEWDPDLFIDLHTTDGSYHGYILTYAPGLNANTNPAVTLVRDRLLPLIRKRMAERYREATFSYGNFRSQDPDSLSLGWETYDARPRFGTNWMGLRGRLSVLSEGYSHAPFKDRVRATYDFVHEILKFAAEQQQSIKAAIRSSDAQRPESVAVRSVLAPATEQDVIAEITADSGEGAGEYALRRRTGVYRTLRMPVFDRFAAARKERRPAAYIIPPRLTDVVGLLQRQGIVVQSLTREKATVQAESFAVESLSVEPLFEGHRTIRVEGRWSGQSVDTLLNRGWYLVSTDQPLGTLATYLLEPGSEDGVVTWNVLDRELEKGKPYPILRLLRPWRTPALTIP
jgi:hypothetical protein